MSASPVVLRSTCARTIAVILALLATPVSAAVSPTSPKCKVFINAVVGENDAWGDSYVGNLREELLKTNAVTLVPAEKDAGVEVGVVTVKSSPGATAVTRLVMLVLRMRLAAELPPDEKENATAPHVDRIVVRGPHLAIYNKATLAEGVAKAVAVVTDRRMVTACEKFSDVTVTAPAPAR